MPLVISLENPAGEEISVEIAPEETFESFIEKARVVLGCDVDMANIIGDREVSPGDNFYNFLNDLASAEAEPEPEEVAKEGDLVEEPSEETQAADESEQRTFYLAEPTAEGDQQIEGEYVQLPDGRIAIVQRDDKETSEFNVNEFMNVNGVVAAENGTSEEQTEELAGQTEEEDQIEYEMLDPDYDEQKVLEEINRLKQNMLTLSSPKKETKKGKASLSELAEMEEEIAKDSPSEPVVAETAKNEKEEIYTQKELLEVLEGSSDEAKKPEENEELKKVFFGENEAKESEDEQYNTLDEEEMERLKKTVKQPQLVIPKLSSSEIEKLTTSGEYLRFYIATMQSKSIQDSSKLDLSKYLPSNYEDVDNEGIYDYENDEDENSLLIFSAKRPRIVPDETDIDKENVIKAVGGLNRIFNKGQKRRGRPRKGTTVATPKKQGYEQNFVYDNSVKIELNGDDDDMDYVPGQEVDWTRRKTPTKGYYCCRFCDELIPSMTAVLSHSQIHRLPGEDTLPCILCVTDYNTLSKLNRHLRIEHPNDYIKAKSPVRKGRPPKKTKIPGTPATEKRPYKFKSKLKGPKSIAQVNDDDDNDVEEVIMLEEWLDEDEEIEYFRNVKCENEQPEPPPLETLGTAEQLSEMDISKLLEKVKEVAAAAPAPSENTIRIEILLPNSTVPIETSVQIDPPTIAQQEAPILIENINPPPEEVPPLEAPPMVIDILPLVDNTAPQPEISEEAPLQIGRMDSEGNFVPVENHTVMNCLPSLDPLPVDESAQIDTNLKIDISEMPAEPSQGVHQAEVLSGALQL